jgi:hypothetical protein
VKNCGRTIIKLLYHRIWAWDLLKNIGIMGSLPKIDYKNILRFKTPGR